MTHGGVVIVLHLYLLEQCLNLVFVTLIKTRNFVIFYKFLSHLSVHHTPSGHGSVLPCLGNVLLSLLLGG
jgi:hypothetical protein